VVIWVTEEQEYEASIRDGRPAMGRPWPVEQMEVVLSPLGEAGKVLEQHPKFSECARNKQEITRLLPARDVAQEESLERSWWWRVLGGAASEVVEASSAHAEPVGKSLEEFERYTRTKSLRP
jgi:hypothetical protein